MGARILQAGFSLYVLVGLTGLPDTIPFWTFIYGYKLTLIWLQGIHWLQHNSQEMAYLLGSNPQLWNDLRFIITVRRSRNNIKDCSSCLSIGRHCLISKLVLRKRT